MSLLPVARNKTFTGGSSVDSGTLDDIQDCIVGKKCGPTTRTQFPVLGFAGAWTPTLSGGNFYLLSGAGGIGGMVPLYTETGDRITACVLSAFGDGAVDVTYLIGAIDPGMTAAVVLGSITDSNRAAAWGNVTIPITPRTMLVGESLYLLATPNAANARLGNLRTTYDRL